MVTRAYERDALLVLYQVLNSMPTATGGSSSVGIENLKDVVHYVRAIRDDSMLLIDALRQGDREEVQERTEMLRTAYLRIMARRGVGHGL